MDARDLPAEFAPFALATVTLDERATLFRQGDPARCLYFLRSGRVRLIRQSESGHALVLHVARAGATFAEGALFAQTYHCDAMAASEAIAVSLDKQALLAHLASEPALAMRMLERVTRQLHHARALAEMRNIRSAKARVLAHLRLSARGSGQTVELDGPQAEIADELGLSAEAVYRCLAQLAREGAIARDGRRIVLLPPAET
ncbi:MAG TPA: Crp/Fnr family transcriptional regulator [Burkholderiaceae bacterium]